ncbi:hypothetical protein NDN08_004974 [Rhodosorus marinus]|uniref:Carbonic anhydrase n=1 Tax=Rhodosorus marinus TaxID=101924 RepID=A0AAV8UF53_9RHOD|nr:hypothetical protein NDN08_004974 [Rhodosorus marinus]
MQNNANWSRKMTNADPEFFSNLEKMQQPKYLWIGCSDSRVPANQVVDLPPGAVFVHRNIANVVAHSDFNCLSVMQYAVQMLKVQHIIVCGHYGCGGVAAALEDQQLGLIDNWLRHVRDVHHKHFNVLNKKLFPLSEKKKLDLLCELNVIESVKNVCHTTIVQSAWARNQPLSVHGWIYRLNNGIVQDLGVTISSPEDISQVYRTNEEDSNVEMSADEELQLLPSGEEEKVGVADGQK